MKALATIMGIIAPTAAFAADKVTNHVFVSGPLILLFLGFCAVVVVVQLIPAMIMLYSMIKGIVSSEKEASATNK